MNRLESSFYALWKSLGGPDLQNEVMMKDVVPEWKGRHRLDFYNERYRFAIEINGGTFQGMRSHASGPGLRRDYVKSMILQSAGIKCIYIDSPLSRNRSFISALIKWLVTNNYETLYPIALQAQKKQSRKSTKKKKK